MIASPVILRSEATKNLLRLSYRGRSFAEPVLSEVEGLRMTKGRGGEAGERQDDEGGAPLSIGAISLRRLTVVSIAPIVKSTSSSVFQRPRPNRSDE